MKFSLITFVLSVLLSTAVASEDVELELVPRYEWDEALIQKRQDPASEPDVALEDQAQLLWTTPNSK